MDYVKFDDSKKFYYQHDENHGFTNTNHVTQHYHNLFEIYFMEKGSCDYFIDNKSYRVDEGDVVLIPEGVIHNTMYNTETHSRHLINCSGRFIPASVASFMPSIIYLYRNPHITDRIRDIFIKIEDEYKNGDSFSSDICHCYTHMLFFLLARNTNYYSEAGTGSIYIEEIIRNIQENFAGDISLSETAKRYSISPEHLSRTFKKETGFGFMEYVTIVRLRQAEYMLRHSGKTSISEIAYSCGFNDSNYFSQKFKKFHGFSPSKIKNQKRQKN
ncbi:MAG: helix-turn-helix transcriptional regulator [Clostridia bacterium]|nr:helix-turn-helix transcriptional regulator [Clostridia bacterium]